MYRLVTFEFNLHGVLSGMYESVINLIDILSELVPHVE